MIFVYKFYLCMFGLKHFKNIRFLKDKKCFWGLKRLCNASIYASGDKDPLLGLLLLDFFHFLSYIFYLFFQVPLIVRATVE